jgi:Endoplasmic reticulum vesicle transporter/Endoplasmic Reticulum-Golgi Intermediate Compartment (ERGIC)
MHYELNQHLLTTMGVISPTGGGGGSWRRMDAFRKARVEVQQSSVVGGSITLFAAAVAALLLLGQLITYLRGTTTHSLSLSQPIPIPLVPLEESSLYRAATQQIGRIPLQIHITFPHVACDMLDIMHDGASLSNGDLDKVHGHHSMVLRPPTFLELKKALPGEASTSSHPGCTVIGQLRPLVVAGTVAVTFNAQAWASATAMMSMMNFQNLLDGPGEALNNGRPPGLDMNDKNRQMMLPFNVSHYVHKIEFGRAFPQQNHKPLEQVRHTVDNEFFGIAVVQTQVKLVPTVYVGGSTSSSPMYQSSVVDTTIQPRTLVAQGVQQLPGLVLSYDFTPLTVHHSAGRDNILVFISSLISIVSGVYVTVSLLSSCLVHSAQAVAKKID